MNLVRPLLLVLILFWTEALCQTQSLSQGPYKIEIVLEREENGSWTAIDSRLVLDQGDRVRFRVRANFAGYLYVTNQSTSGTYQLLFPEKDNERRNKIESGRDYLIPAAEGWFRIAGPPGHEVVYWLVSPVELGDSNTKRPHAGTDANKPSRLMPRCDDTILRARGDCVDAFAGPREIAPDAKLPADLSPYANLRSRDLVFIRQDKASVVSSPVALSQPVIYEFRIAHR